MDAGEHDNREDDGVRPWFVLPVRQRSELSLETKIRALGYGAMAPWHEGQRYVRGNRRKWRRPLYVGYLFVSFPSGHDAGWQHLNSELNTFERKTVFRLLGGDAPAALRPFDVMYLHMISDGRYKPENAAPTFVIGDRVLVPDGYLQGRTSTIVSIRRGKKATLKVKGEKNDIYMERSIAILERT
jgi:transcription antitermination factor NusG